MSDFFNDIYMQIDNSKCYLDYWNRTSGINKKLFNRICNEQLDLMLNCLNIKKNDLIVDIGCGNGEMLNFIVNNFSASGIGIDSSSYGIDIANKNSVGHCNFVVGRLEEFDTYLNVDVDVLIAVDSLGRTTDFKTLGHAMTKKASKDFRGGIFHSEVILPQEPKKILEYDKTEVGIFLERLGVNYKAYDCTELELNLWKKSIDILNSMKMVFFKEGSEELYLDSLDDSISFLKVFEEKRIKRYFYFFDFSQKK